MTDPKTEQRSLFKQGLDVMPAVRSSLLRRDTSRSWVIHRAWDCWGVECLVEPRQVFFYLSQLANFAGDLDPRVPRGHSRWQERLYDIVLFLLDKVCPLGSVRQSTDREGWKLFEIFSQLCWILHYVQNVSQNELLINRMTSCIEQWRKGHMGCQQFMMVAFSCGFIV